MASGRSDSSPRSRGTSGRPRWQLVAVVIVFLASREFIFSELEPMSADTTYYADLALRGVDRGQVPYRDFTIEYPPVAWWVILFPKWIDPESYPVGKYTSRAAQQYASWYFSAFHCQMFLIDVGCLVLMYLVGRGISRRAEWGLPAVYTLVGLAQPYLLFDRLDVGLMLLVLLWIYCNMRSGAGSGGAMGWALASYFFLGLGFSFKIVPAFCFPFAWLADWRASPSPQRPAALAGAFALAALGPFLLQMQTAGWSILGVFHFHIFRQINLDSIWASLMLLARLAGVPVSVIFTDNGYDVAGPWHGALKSSVSLVLVAAALLLGLWAIRRGKAFDRRTSLDAAYLALINSMVLSHVISPQYFIWAIPLAVLLAIDVFPRRPHWWWALALLSATTVGISSWLFPRHYQELTNLEAWAVGLAITRSGCLVALAILLNVAFFRHYGLRPPILDPGPQAH